MSRPLAGRRIVVTRPARQARSLVDRLTDLGAEVVVLPLIEAVAVRERHAVESALAALGDYDAMIVTSANGAEFLADALAARERGLPAGLLVVAIGEATSMRMAERGLRVDRMPPRATGAGIVDALAEAGVQGMRILLARARAGRPELVEGLLRAGARVDDVAFYDTILLTPAPEALSRALAADEVVVTAPSAVESLVAAGGDRVRGLRVVSIGPTTSAAAREAGLEVVAEARDQSAGGIVDALLSARPARG